MFIENKIDIDGDWKNMINKAKKVEDFPKFASSYTQSQVIKEDKNKIIIRRSAYINQTLISWHTALRKKQPGNILNFKVIDGPMKGMKTTWEFIPQSKNKTTLKIIHSLESGSNQQLNYLKNILPSIANQFLNEFKGWCESE